MKVKRHKEKIKKIAVLSSGGDAPGMNAAIRSVVRSGIYLGMEVYGVHQGYSGLISGKFEKMELSSVANIIHRGGTILKSARCLKFKQMRYRKQALEQMKERGIQGLIVLGGDGSFRGAHALWADFKFPVMGVPCTIDNDLFGTDITIGFDTATNTALSAIDKIRDTASSHERIFIVEVMGRDTGFIAMDVGVSGGADAIVVPEAPMSTAQIIKRIERGAARGKNSCIIVMAEGKKAGNSMVLARQLKKIKGYQSRVVILGHVQRGGSPSTRDRKVASAMGAYAVREMKRGYTDAMAGVRGRSAVLVPLQESFKKRKTIQKDLIQLADVLAT